MICNVLIKFKQRVKNIIFRMKNKFDIKMVISISVNKEHPIALEEDKMQKVGKNQGKKLYMDYYRRAVKQCNDSKRGIPVFTGGRKDEIYRTAASLAEHFTNFRLVLFVCSFGSPDRFNFMQKLQFAKKVFSSPSLV